MTDALDDLRDRLNQAASGLRTGDHAPERTLALIEESARLATEAASHVESAVRAAVEPLPDLPGQLPLPAVS